MGDVSRIIVRSPYDFILVCFEYCRSRRIFFFFLFSSPDRAAGIDRTDIAARMSEDVLFTRAVITAFARSYFARVHNVCAPCARIPHNLSSSSAPCAKFDLPTRWGRGMRLIRLVLTEVRRDMRTRSSIGRVGRFPHVFSYVIMPLE